MEPANVKVIHAHEFVRARPGGVFDLEASEALLLDIARAAEGLDRVEVLIDTRQAEGQLGAADLPVARFDRARFFALLADSKGFDVEAFTSYEEAVAWLSGEEA